MLLSIAYVFFLSGFPHVKATKMLPDIGDLIELAYPTWCIDENEKRLTDLETCEDGTPNGKFTPLYFTKQHSGGDPKLGGYPTNIDIQYAFEYAAPYFGQACAGSPHHCSESFDGSTTNCKKCPKISSDKDSGPYGPGHVPPHISLAAVTRAYNDGLVNADCYNFEQNACRIMPQKLLELIRLYYPRGTDGKAKYPPPFSEEGGNYAFEFVNLFGDSCEEETKKHGELICFEQHSSGTEYPDYLEVGHGSPHYCTKDGKTADVNDDWCPYIFFGPNRGKYRHPHIAFSAVETYIAHELMPDKCGTTWDDKDYPSTIDTTVAFPKMVETDSGSKNAHEQPAITDDGKWTWPGPEGTKKKAVIGNFATNLYNDGSDDGSENQTTSGVMMVSMMPSLGVVTAFAVVVELLV